MKNLNYKGVNIVINDYDNEEKVKQLFDNFITSQKNYSSDNIERCYYENGNFHIVSNKNSDITNQNITSQADNKIDIYDLVDQALDNGYTFEYADTFPALYHNVVEYIKSYLEDNDIDYVLTKQDLKEIKAEVKDFYDDNVDESYHNKKSYSLEEAFKDLRNPKKNLKEDINTEKDNFEAAVRFYQTNPKNLNDRQLANNIGKYSEFNLPDHLVSAILNGVTDYAEATEFDGNDAIAELRDNIESLKGKNLDEVLSFLDSVEFAENWNTFNIIDSNNNLIFDNDTDLGENDWYASISDLCYNGPLQKYSDNIVKDIIIDSKHSSNMDARKVTIVL